MPNKPDAVIDFARNLSPEAAQRFGRGLAEGLAAVLPEASRILAREISRKTIPIKDLWESAGMGESHYYKLVRSGRGPRTIREGAHHVVRIADAERWLANLAAGSTASGAVDGENG